METDHYRKWVVSTAFKTEHFGKWAVFAFKKPPFSQGERFLPYRNCPFTISEVCLIDDFPRRPQIFVGDRHNFVGGPHIFIGNPIFSIKKGSPIKIWGSPMK